MKNRQMQNSGSEPDCFPVYDFYLTAFMIASGFELAGAERADSNRVLFLLRDTPERAQAVSDFYGHRASIDPLAFKDAIVNLKSMIHGMAPGHFAEKYRLFK